MKQIYNIATFALLIIVLSSQTQSSDDFIRYIDRPLQDKSGVFGIAFGVAGEKRLHYDSISIRLSQRFSYAVTDNVTFCDLPWPIIQVRLKPSLPGSTLLNGWDALALSLRFGAVGTLDYTVLPRIELLAKISLFSNIWAQNDLIFATVGDEAIQGFIYPRIGCQFTRNFYGLIGYRGGFFRFIDNVDIDDRKSYYYLYGYNLDYFHTSNADQSKVKDLSYASSVPIEIGLDLGNHFSLLAATSLGKNTGTWVPAELRCRIKW